MNDTSPKVARLVEQWHENAGSEKRVEIASQMFDTARTIILSSLPQGLSRREQRLAFIERLYGDELPLAAKIAFADYPVQDEKEV